jgi:hypothetical protein
VASGAFAQNKGALTIVCNQSGAQVFVAGRLVGSTTPNFSMLLPINQNYEIKVTKAGFKDFVTTIKMVSSGVTVNVNLEPVGGATTTTTTTTATGRFNVTYTSSVANTDVYLDGVKKGRCPIVIPTDAGTHTVKFVASGYDDDVQTINVTGPMSVSGNPKARVVNYNLTVTANVANADVYIQGVLAGKAPLTKQLPAGSYTVAVKAAGYVDFSQNIVISGNQTINAILNPNTVSLTVNANLNGADVYVNGTMVGKTPYVSQFAPGNYTVTVKAPGYYDFNATVSLTGPQTVTASLVGITGKLVITVNGSDKLKEMQVYVDGKKVNNFPVELTPGTHQLQITIGPLTYVGTITIEAGQTLTIEPQLIIQLK